MDDAARTPLWAGGDVPLTHPRALVALAGLVGEPDLVDQIVRAFPSWSALVGCPRSELAFKVGPWAAQLRLPEYCPDLPDTGKAVCVGRYDRAYPAHLAALPDAPLVLYLRGRLPGSAALAVGGPLRASPGAVELARTAGEVSARTGVVLAVSLEDACGRAAASAACALGGTVIAVVATSLARPGTHDAHIREILDAGGGVCGEVHATTAPTQALAAATARIVTALAGVLVLPEVGTTLVHGSAFAATAIAAQLPIVVAEPTHDTSSDCTHAQGALASAPRFSPALFGTSPRIQSRLAAGLDPADAVVHSVRELAHLVARLATSPALHAGVDPSALTPPPSP